MITRILTTLGVLASVLCVSCYPVQENPPRRPHRPHPSPHPTASDESATLYQPLPQPVSPPPAARSAQPATQPGQSARATPLHSPRSMPRATPPPAPAKDQPATAPKQGNPVAQKAPGKDGYVLSPYTHKLILVRGIPSGTVVPDQTSPASEKKFFVVP